MPKIDICVLTAGRFDMLERCLDAIEQEITITPCNVYVYDNGSPSEERMKNGDIFAHPIITKHKRSNHNLGFPKGANNAIRMGTAPLVLFISDDIMLHPGAIQSLLETMSNPKIGMCGLKLVFPLEGNDVNRPAGKIQHIGHSVDLRGNILHPCVGWSANNPKCCVSREVFSVTGATFMVRRDAFNKVGGFNEVYGKGYFEDVELALQMRGLGYKIWVDTDAVADHYVGATFVQRKENIPIQDNQKLFLSRNQKFLVWTDWEMR